MSRQFAIICFSLIYSAYAARNETSTWGCRAESLNSTSDFNPVADMHLYDNGANWDVLGTFSNFKNKSLVAMGDTCKENQIIQSITVAPYVSIQSDLVIASNLTSVNISSSIKMTDAQLDKKNRTCHVFTYLNDGADKGKLKEIACGNWILISSYTGVSLVLIGISLISLLF